VTINGAKALNLEGYGIVPGAHADLIVLQAADPIEALRLRPARLQVIRRGVVIAESPAAESRLTLGNQSLLVDFTRH
jgi:cytosine deaminase